MSKNRNNTPGRNEMLKAAMLEALKKNFGIITAACEAAGMSRSLYYQLIKEDPVFKEQCEDISEIVTDYVESKMFKRITNDDPYMIQFYLNAKARRRGYGNNVIQENIVRQEPSAEAKELSETLKTMTGDPDYQRAIEAQKQLEAKLAAK